MVQIQYRPLGTPQAETKSEVYLSTVGSAVFPGGARRRVAFCHLGKGRNMPRLSVSLWEYRKHRASGQAVVTICGKDHCLGPHSTKVSKIEYDGLDWHRNL